MIMIWHWSDQSLYYGWVGGMDSFLTRGGARARGKFFESRSSPFDSHITTAIAHSTVLLLSHEKRLLKSSKWTVVCCFPLASMSRWRLESWVGARVAAHEVRKELFLKWLNRQGRQRRLLAKLRLERPKQHQRLHDARYCYYRKTNGGASESAYIPCRGRSFMQPHRGRAKYIR